MAKLPYFVWSSGGVSEHRTKTSAVAAAQRIRGCAVVKKRGRRTWRGAPSDVVWSSPSCPSNLGALPSWWPFTKKKAKRLPEDPRPMARTIYVVPGPHGTMLPSPMRGARRRRRKRRR